MSAALWAPYDPAYAVDPYSMYTRLRSEDPVHLSQTGEWIITSYADVKFVLKSPLFRSGNRLEWLKRGVQYLKSYDQELSDIASAINKFILFLNPPDHTRIRSFVARAWDDRNVETLVTNIVENRLRGIQEEAFDVVKEFADPVPVEIICEIMGIPPGDYAYLRELGVGMHRSLDLYHTYKDLVQLNKTAREFVSYFDTLISNPSRLTDTGLISKLIRSNNGQVEPKHLTSICIFLFTASEETTCASIGTALLNLISRPDKYDWLRAQADALPKATEELLRFDPPVQLLGRIANEPVTLGGKTLPAEAALTLVLGSANRDPLQFEHADELVLNRTPNHHLAFSSGIHFCLGDWLGKIQTRIAIERFMKRFPRVHITSKELVWKKNIAVRGLTSLRVSTK